MIIIYCFIIGCLPAFCMALLIRKVSSGSTVLWWILCINAFVLGFMLAYIGQYIANSLGYHTLFEDTLASIVCAFVGCFFSIGSAWVILWLVKTRFLIDGVISVIYYIVLPFLVLVVVGQLGYLIFSAFPASDSAQITSTNGFVSSDVTGADLFGRFRFENNTNNTIVLCIVRDSQDTNCDLHAQGWYQGELFGGLTGSLGGEIVLHPHQQITVVFDRSDDLYHIVVYHIVVKNDVSKRLTIIYPQQSLDAPDDEGD